MPSAAARRAASVVLPTMAAALERRQLDADNHRSRPLTSDEVESSRLVISMTEEHRHAVNRMVPSVVARSYTLPEIDRLVSSDHWAPEWDGTADAFERLRGLRPLVPGPDQPEDVVDPAGHSQAIAVAVLHELLDRVTRVSGHLFG